MKHLTYAEKTVLLDDDTADWLVEYARALGSVDRVDAVTVRAIDISGHEVDASFLLNKSTQISAESTNSAVEAPTNSDAVRYMQDQTGLIVSPPPAQPADLLDQGGE